MDGIRMHFWFHHAVLLGCPAWKENKKITYFDLQLQHLMIIKKSISKVQVVSKNCSLECTISQPKDKILLQTGLEEFPPIYYVTIQTTILVYFV